MADKKVRPALTPAGPECRYGAALGRFGLSRFRRELAAQIVVGHGGHGRVGPDVHAGLNHVDDGVDGQNGAHQVNRHIHGAHERERQEVAAHGHAGIADCGEHGHEQPDNHGPRGNDDARVLHEEQG